jgi:hypothetical protein
VDFGFEGKRALVDDFGRLARAATAPSYAVFRATRETLWTP